jgi:hypothetical protein
MSICPRCGHQNQGGAKFCSQCAAALPAAAPAPAPGFYGGPAPAPAPKPKKNKLIFLLPLLFVGQALLFVFIFAGNGCSGSVEGQIVSVGKPHGDYTLVPTSCFSGEHESFFGVWVTPDLQSVDGRQGFKGGLKIVKAHTGEWQLFVESPEECDGLQCKIRPLDTSSCKVFDVSVENTNTTINDIRVRAGHATLDCETPEGGHLEAKLVFDGCS